MLLVERMSRERPQNNMWLLARLALPELTGIEPYVVYLRGGNIKQVDSAQWSEFQFNFLLSWDFPYLTLSQRLSTVAKDQTRWVLNKDRLQASKLKQGEEEKVWKERTPPRVPPTLISQWKFNHVQPMRKSCFFNKPFPVTSSAGPAICHVLRLRSADLYKVGKETHQEACIPFLQSEASGIIEKLWTLGVVTTLVKIRIHRCGLCTIQICRARSSF